MFYGLRDVLQGWSNENTLKRIEEERAKYKEKMRREYDKFKAMKITKPNQIVRLDPIVRSRQSKEVANQAEETAKDTSDVTEAVEELVPLLAKNRKVHAKIPLGSTDVTGNFTKYCNQQKTDINGHKYLQELSNQISYKRNKMKVCTRNC